MVELNLPRFMEVIRELEPVTEEDVNVCKALAGNIRYDDMFFDNVVEETEIDLVGFYSC